MVYKIKIPGIDLDTIFETEAKDTWQALKNILFEQFPEQDKQDLVRRVERILVAKTYFQISPCQLPN